MENLIPAVLGAIFGAVLGSFTTMLVWRLHFDEVGIVRGRSHCPHCKENLGILDLVPILSWLVQGGKCRYCPKSISAYYPLTEMVFAVCGFLFVQKFYSEVHFVPILITAFLTLVLFVYDARFMEVDRRISWPAIVFALGWAFTRELPWQDYLIGGAVGFLFYGFQYFYSKIFRPRPWVGAGDMELGLFMGLVLGWEYLLLAMFVAYLGGVLVALPLLLLQKADGQTKLPMGAFLMPALLLFLYGGDQIWEWWYWEFLGRIV